MAPAATPLARRANWPKNPRRDTLTAEASLSADRPIFSNMMHLLQVGIGNGFFRRAFLCRRCFTFAMPVLRFIMGAGEDIADVSLVADDALGSDHALLIDQESEERGEHLVFLGQVQAVLMEDGESDRRLGDP